MQSVQNYTSGVNSYGKVHKGSVYVATGGHRIFISLNSTMLIVAGGSGYIGGVTGGSMQNGVQSGNGYARITLVTISS